MSNVLCFHRKQKHYEPDHHTILGLCAASADVVGDVFCVGGMVRKPDFCLLRYAAAVGLRVCGTGDRH